MIYTWKVLKKCKLGKKGDIIELELKISQYDDFKKDFEGILERYISTAPAIRFDGKTFGSLEAQTDDTFKEVMAKIGENHPNSPLADKYAKNKTVKSVKTRQVIDKHLRKKK